MSKEIDQVAELINVVAGLITPAIGAGVEKARKQDEDKMRAKTEKQIQEAYERGWSNAVKHIKEQISNAYDTGYVLGYRDGKEGHDNFVEMEKRNDKKLKEEK